MTPPGLRLGGPRRSPAAPSSPTVAGATTPRRELDAAAGRTRLRDVCELHHRPQSPTCLFNDSTTCSSAERHHANPQRQVPPRLQRLRAARERRREPWRRSRAHRRSASRATDADSGVRSATLTLTPARRRRALPPHLRLLPECSYDSWNACPLTQSVSGFALDTSTLSDDTYAVDLASPTPPATSRPTPSGTIVSDNAPTNASVPNILVPERSCNPARALSAQPGVWSAPSDAGTITYGISVGAVQRSGRQPVSRSTARKARATPLPPAMSATPCECS